MTATTTTSESVVTTSVSTAPTATSRYPLSTQLVLGFILVVTILLASCGNGLLCMLVWRKAAMRAHANNIMLASLSCADALLAVLCMPADLVTVAADGDWLLGDAVCRMQAFTFALLSGGASHSLMIISVDRYRLLVRQRPEVSSTATAMLLALGWALSALLALPMLVGWPGFLPFTGQTRGQLRFATTRLQVAYVCTLFVLMWLLPSAVTLTCHALLLAGVRRGGRVGVVEGGRVILPAHTMAGGLWAAGIRLQTRTLATVLLLVATFALFRWPYVLVAFVGNLGQCAPTTNTPYLLCWSYAGLAIDPLLFVWRIRRFRAACFNVVPKCCWCYCWPPRSFSFAYRHQRIVCPSVIYRASDSSTSWPGSTMIIARH